MKTYCANLKSCTGLVAACLLAISATAGSADKNDTLKDAFKGCFMIGASISPENVLKWEKLGQRGCRLQTISFRDDFFWATKKWAPPRFNTLTL
jgi:hypothetical protein